MAKGAVPAVVEATKTRIVPVTMASGTTILGMLPLLGDAMFAGMAATIMGGLFVSTILTIFVLPVTYCIFFKNQSRQIMKTNLIYILGMMCLSGTVSAQTTVNYTEFEQKVLDYSQTLKQSVSQRTAMQKSNESCEKLLSSPQWMPRVVINIV